MKTIRALIAAVAVAALMLETAPETCGGKQRLGSGILSKAPANSGWVFVSTEQGDGKGFADDAFPAIFSFEENVARTPYRSVFSSPALVLFPPHLLQNAAFFIRAP